ncbi:MAG TPA: DJ-1/PfpI family protein [Thermodesulfobacteriota bacterium]|nr:DJ-1/PfpI family protein [Thermodesulfobacteriota bacterium]
MNIAFVVFNGLTFLDFIGVYDALTRLKTMGFDPSMKWDVCSFTDDVADDRGLRLVPGRTGQALASYDLLVVPGGFGTRTLVKDSRFLEWLKTAETCPLKVSVCTGALLLGAVGFLKGKKATTHPGAFEELRPYCGQVLESRIVDEGNVVTARGVSSSIDLGLYMVERIAGQEARKKIARQMDYPYAPAPGDIVRANAP